jgi:hypothetical protein
MSVPASKKGQASVTRINWLIFLLLCFFEDRNKVRDRLCSQNAEFLNVTVNYWRCLQGGYYDKSHTLRQLLITVYQSEFLSLLIHPPELSGINQQKYLVAKQEKFGEKWRWILSTKYLFHTMHGSLTCHTVFRNWASGFTSPQKEVILRVFIVMKSPSSSAGYESANLGSHGKHANH